MMSADEKKSPETLEKAATAAEGGKSAHSTASAHHRRVSHKAHAEIANDSDEDSDNQAEPFEKRSEGGTCYLAWY
jgi:hypothetical protein